MTCSSSTLKAITVFSVILMPDLQTVGGLSYRLHSSRCAGLIFNNCPITSFIEQQPSEIIYAHHCYKKFS